jgi:hypothetical protein
MSASADEVAWVAAGLRQAAADAGVMLPVLYSLSLVSDGLAREPELALSRLGAGVVVHTHPEDRSHAIVLGYADARGQWYGDGRRHVEAQAPEASAPVLGPDL